MKIQMKYILSILAIGLITPLVVFGAGRFAKPSIVEGSIETNQVKIQWDKVAHIKSYQLRLFNANCSERIRKYSISKYRTRKKITSLTADTKYCIKMRAKYTDGTHDRFSKPRKFRTLADTDVGPQFGVNFIPYFSTDSDAITEATQPAAMEAIYDDLGVDIFRQLTSADVIWSNVAVSEDQFDFTNPDLVLLTTTHEPVVDLFSYQYADGTTPEDELLGDTTPEKSLTTEQETYIGTVVDHYKDYVTYWEIGNEMAHWESDFPGEFTPEEQGVWLASVAEVIKAHDPDAMILLPGLINITDDNTDDWLTGVVAGGGADWFDIVDYHYYNRWQAYEPARAALQETLVTLGIDDKPVWLTETGATSDNTLNNKTDYPNSTTEQAADVFRRTIPSYAAGDVLAIWHTLIGNDDDGNNFRYFGLFYPADMSKKPAYYAVQLLTSYVLPFSTVEKQSDYIYKISKTDGIVCYVAWSATNSSWTIPEGMGQTTSVVPNDDGSFTWTTVSPGDAVDLTTTPVLVIE